MNKNENKGVEAANSYKYYNLTHKSEAQDKIPEWMKGVITNKKERPNVSKYKGIYP